MVQAVVAGPPQRPLLGGRGAAECEQELERPARLVGLVGEVPVVPARDEEHATPVGDEQDHPVVPPDPGEDGEKRDEMEDHERERCHRFDSFPWQTVRVGHSAPFAVVGCVIGLCDRRRKAIRQPRRQRPARGYCQ